MIPIVTEGIEAYAEAHTTPLPAVFADLAAATTAEFAAPQMMVGPLEGRFLELLVFALAPRLVLEIGTFTGFSSLAMAGALPPGGRIITCDINPEAQAAGLRAAHRQGRRHPHPPGLTPVAVQPASTQSGLTGFDGCVASASCPSENDPARNRACPSWACPSAAVTRTNTVNGLCSGPLMPWAAISIWLYLGRTELSLR